MVDSVAVVNGSGEKWCGAMQRTRTGPTILVVEDYPDSRQMLKLLLESLDYSVLTAANGKDALALAANNQVNLIIVDFDLPDMTGPTVVRQIRQLRDPLQRVPIVMLTAFDGYEYRRLADEAGCNAFLVKPPNFEVLSEVLDRLLRQAEAPCEKPEPALAVRTMMMVESSKAFLARQ